MAYLFRLAFISFLLITQEGSLPSEYSMIWDLPSTPVMAQRSDRLITQSLADKQTFDHRLLGL